MNYEDIGVPVIPFEVKGDKWHEIWGFVDSGATYTTLHSEEGHRLGIDPFSGEKIMVTVGDGGSIPVYLLNYWLESVHMNSMPLLAFQID